MTSSELKALYQAAKPDGHFFDRETMKFFGDTMANYGVIRFEHDGVPYATLHRKRPVKHGHQASAYFDLRNMNDSTIHPAEREEHA